MTNRLNIVARAGSEGMGLHTMPDRYVRLWLSTGSDTWSILRCNEPPDVVTNVVFRVRPTTDEAAEYTHLAWDHTTPNRPKKSIVGGR